ncbi:FtsX-like permease family protein [uncultured Ruminococcus sp.]|uniref:FtsX-like permease family protein n=1 Tax=uncultured Ruminococcus sp. TaxID=165186 RepID=UPI0025FE179C|nr:FtsX-like permease family protein [uncultured Ruminococcus sp.]
MKKKALNQDIQKSFSKSKGRFISIACLIALGSFALVGLQVTGPDMRKTTSDYLQQYHAADLSVIGSMGIDQENAKTIDSLDGTEQVTYGYLKDVVLKDTSESCRIFSLDEDISKYEVVSGRLPEKADEIAFADADKDNYQISDQITFEEKADTSGNTVLKNKTFTITGFVHSTEILSCVNQGQSTAGSGELNSYAVVTEDAFDCDYYMIARITFRDTQGLDPYSDAYTDKIQAHKNQLETLLEDAPAQRLDAVRSEYQEKIDDGRQQIAEAETELDDAKTKLDDAKAQIQDAEQQIQDNQAELDSKVSDAQQQIDENQKKLEDSEKQLADGKTQLASAKTQLDAAQAKITASENQIAAGKQELSAKQAEYNTQKAAFTEKQTEYQQNAEALSAAQTELDSNRSQLTGAKSQYESGIAGIVQNTTMISQINVIVKSLNKIMWVLIVVAVLLGVVILYNLTNINVSERIRELSTIKVLGFYDKEVTLYIYRETIILTLLGILVGFLTGDWLYQYIITVVPPDEVMFNPALSARAFLIPFVLISMITAVLGTVINRRLQNVDMLDALKSVE